MTKSMAAPTSGGGEAALLAATLRIIGRAGIDGVTHRAVAAEAGVSLGAVTHHFRSRDALVERALKFAVTRETSRLQALTLSLQTHAFSLEAWIAQLTGWYAKELRDDPETHIACYEAFLSAARHPRHQPLVADLFETWRQSAELALRAAGSTMPSQHAEIFVAALIGIVLHELSKPQRGFRQRAGAALLALANGLVTARR